MTTVASSHEPVWRVVAVLEAASPAEGGRVQRSLCAALAHLDLRAYRSGRHLVLVAAVRGVDGSTAEASLAATLTPRLTGSARVADTWHGPRPLGPAAVPRVA